jgi:hypothetical protein
MSRIIREERGCLTLANRRGCRVVLAPQDGHYGLGEFFFQDRPVGPPVPHVVKIGDKFENSANPWSSLFDGRWRPGHRASQVEVLHNEADKGVVRMTGREGFLDVSATCTMHADCPGISLDVSATVWRASIWWPIFVSLPFHPQAMEFVQVPLEVPLRRDEGQRWAVTMRRWHAPVMLACQIVEGRETFVAVGFHLQQPRLKECLLEYAPEDGEGALRAYFPGRLFPGCEQGVGPGEKPEARTYVNRTVVAFGASQCECVEGYRELCGYDVSTDLHGDVEESLDELFDVYRDAQVYVSVEGFKNKAYKQQITPEGEEYEPGYGRYIPIGVNAQLACQFYLRYLSRPDQTWLRDRAFNMAGFFCESQMPSGAVPTLHWPAEKRFSAYIPPLTDAGYLYATCQMSMGAYALHRLAALVEEHEGDPCSAWREAALKAMDFVVARQEKDGILGRSYADDGRHDDVAAPNWPLIALDYFHAVTGHERYARSRDALEEWTLEHFAGVNLWFGWSTDAGCLVTNPVCLNVDVLDTLTFVTYCVYRHRRTGDAKYLRAAEDVLAYVWTCTIPVQYEDHQHVTKGLTFEQFAYHCFDLPFRTCLLVDALPYLAAVTGKRFYMDFYRLMVQTQLAYQMDPPWAAFHIGLGMSMADVEPADTLSEQENKYIVEFASLYLEAQQSLGNYRYVGGPDWGVGVDYEVPFEVHAAAAEPYVIASSHRLVDVHWDEPRGVLELTLAPRLGWPGEARVSWKRSDAPELQATFSGTEDQVHEVEAQWDAESAVATLHLPRTSEEQIVVRLRDTRHS